MKIGTFAEKHDVSMHTIRHYLDLQLLLAEKVGTQYHFTQQDSDDMEEIMELKRLNFSLTEIQDIFAYKRLDGNGTVEFRNHFRSFLENKKQELKIQQQEIEKAMSYVEGKLYELKLKESNRLLGLPIEMVHLLRCPYCRNPLNLSEGMIENNMVMSGKMSCKCLYNLVIEDGIIVDRSAIREKNTPTKAEYYEKTSPKFINFIFKSIETLVKLFQSEKIQQKTILELSHCSGFFLMKYLPNMPKDTTYILVDYDYKRIHGLKNNLGLNSDHNNFIFFCCDMDRIPLMENSIDLVIDNFIIKEHAKKNGKLLAESIVPLMKAGGHIAGTYPYFTAINFEDGSIPKEMKKFYRKDYLLGMLRAASIQKVWTKERGPVEEGGAYDTYVEGNEYCHLIYLGKKEEVS